MNLFAFFRIRREERRMAWMVLALLVALNILTIAKYHGVFTPLADDYWRLFVGKFHVSGFDPISYYVLSHWEARYNVYRHPLLAFVMWPPYLLNRACMSLLGVNCAPYIMAVILVFAAFYAFLFLYRILREVVGLAHGDASLLCWFLYGFAFVMLSAMVPDHFILSMFLLLLTLYVTGLHIRRRQPMSKLLTVGLFVATAGVSLNNGLKVFLAALFANGRRFFRPAYLLLAVVLPALVLWMGCRYEYRYLVAPGEIARHAAKKAARQAQAEKKKVATAQMAVSDTLAKAQQPPKAKPKKRGTQKGAPLMQGEFMRWTDITTSRASSVVENLFGESIQLHPDYLLQDEFRYRPMIVTYRWVASYVVEALIVALFLVGIWCGRRSRFLWLALSWFALDMALHIGLGFGINEVYIMTAQWAFVIPIAIACLFHRSSSWLLWVLRAIVLTLMLYLATYNGTLIVNYLT